ncbi:ion transporter [Streptomyces nodosus]|uniref:Ion transporter n=1 Tax=Streptomyces nodosus TaxID=40318 RepID=A0A5P2WDB2_9ACTN|nr:ion transporter [Streptomyces nodosus]MBB4794216.1 voltage-gated sodium channel [Streptomyces nodosus]QEV41369.1 ion transporter [Streptomyces nodosus]
MTDVTAGRASVRETVARRSRALTEARWFAIAVFGLIVVNAMLLGLETYSGVVEDWHRWLRLAEHCCVAAFTVEIALRLAAHADRPAAFFRDPWNLFDVVVVASAFLPVVSENTTILRLLRLARVLRTARFLPQLRIVLVAVVRSLPGTLSFLLVGTLVLYVYAMAGWVFFARQDPQHYGSMGRALLTLFLLMTLDGIGEAVHAGLEVSRWSIFYYASYVLLASFVLVNVLIGIVVTSFDEARDLEAEEQPPETPGEPQPLRDRIATVRRALDELESELDLHQPSRSRRGGPEPGRAAGRRARGGHPRGVWVRR